MYAMEHTRMRLVTKIARLIASDSKAVAAKGIEAHEALP